MPTGVANGSLPSPPRSLAVAMFTAPTVRRTHSLSSFRRLLASVGSIRRERCLERGSR